MKKISITVYQYSELSDKAKERARNWYLRDFDGQFEWDCIKEDAKIIYLRLDGTDEHGSMDGSFIQSARVTSEAILKNHGEKCDTYILAQNFEKEWEALPDTDDDGREELESEFLRALLEEYRVMYEKNMEYQSSEEAIAEIMEANEYTFLEDGTMFN
jgi:hypothetical protein